jgi:hypothetical protein
MLCALNGANLAIDQSGQDAIFSLIPGLRFACPGYLLASYGMPKWTGDSLLSFHNNHAEWLTNNTSLLQNCDVCWLRYDRDVLLNRIFRPN